MDILGAARALALACHPLPSAAVTLVAVLLAVGSGSPAQVVVLGSAVLCGQLVIGWHNDLLDVARDRAAGRADKPLARGAVGPRTVAAALGVALVLAVLLSVGADGARGLVLHVGLVVGSGVAYNLGLKGTAWSWVPYAVAFGALPAFVWLSVGRVPVPWWAMVVGALLGVGAHLLNVLPDLEDDLRAGIRGFPHRIGARASRALALVLLVGGTLVVAVAPTAATPTWAWLAVPAAVLMAVLAWSARGRTPFVLAVGIAVLDVVALAARGAG